MQFRCFGSIWFQGLHRPGVQETKLPPPRISHVPKKLLDSFASGGEQSKGMCPHLIDDPSHRLQQSPQLPSGKAGPSLGLGASGPDAEVAGLGDYITHQGAPGQRWMWSVCISSVNRAVGVSRRHKGSHWDCPMSLSGWVASLGCRETPGLRGQAVLLLSPSGALDLCSAGEVYTYCWAEQSVCPQMQQRLHGETRISMGKRSKGMI